MKRACCFIAILLFVTYHCNLLAQSKADSVLWLPLQMAVPANAIKMGSIKVGNNATEINCDYEEVIAEAKKRAKDMGGNIVKITALIPPAFISKCYRIDADVYYCKGLPDSFLRQIATNSRQPDSSKDYVLLYIYRLPDTTMLAPSYSLHLNDGPALCLVKNKSRDVVKIYKEGALALWGKTMHRGTLNFNAKFGETYYIRCGVTGTEFNTTPVIEHVDEKTGSAEYAKKGRKNKDQDVRYLEDVH